jgi:rod shape-determining protein MreB
VAPGFFRNRTLVIDAGSSNTVLASVRGDLFLREPTLAAFAIPPAPPAGSRRRRARRPPLPAAGRDASRLAGELGNGARLIHPIVQGRIVHLEALELVLRGLIRAAGLYRLKLRLIGGRLALVVPPHLEEVERIRFSELMRDFGFGKVRLVEAVVAAAWGSGMDHASPQGRMLVEVGGGKTTVAAFALGERTGWSWHPVGGQDLDRAIIDYVLRRHRIALHPALAEEIKLRIGSVYPHPRPATLEIAGADTATGVEKKVALDDNEIRDVLVDACEPLMMAIQQGFETITPELAGDIARTGITLAGGGALLSGLPEFITERTGLACERAPDSINATIQGAVSLLRRGAG